MRICIISHEYPPFPGGGIATYHQAAALRLAEAGHDVHIVTNNAWYGRSEAAMTQPLWREGNLTVHRVACFDDQRKVPKDARFFDVNPQDYSDPGSLWANHPSNMVAVKIAAFVEMLHAEVDLDVIECPEYYAEAFYIIRRRRTGHRHLYPPVCVHAHTSSRIAFSANRHTWELGYVPHRQMMLREEYCVQNADGLVSPSRSLMQKYQEQFDGRLPEPREVIPYFLDLPEVGSLPEALAGGRPRQWHYRLRTLHPRPLRHWSRWTGLHDAAA